MTLKFHFLVLPDQLLGKLSELPSVFGSKVAAALPLMTKYQVKIEKVNRYKKCYKRFNKLAQIAKIFVGTTSNVFLE